MRAVCRSCGWQAEYEALLGRFSHEYPVVRKARGNGDDNSDWVKGSRQCTDVRELNFSNAQVLDWRAMLGRAWSSSYLLHGGVDREAFDRELRALFERHSRDGRITLAYRLYLLLWRLRGDPADRPVGNRRVRV